MQRHGKVPPGLREIMIIFILCTSGALSQDQEATPEDSLRESFILAASRLWNDTAPLRQDLVRELALSGALLQGAKLLADRKPQGSSPPSSPPANPPQSPPVDPPQSPPVDPPQSPPSDPPSSPPAKPTEPEFFVQVKGGKLVQGITERAATACQVFYIAGFNKYEMLEAGAGAPVLSDGKLIEPVLTAQAVVRQVLDDAVAAKLNMLRINAFANSKQYAVLAPDGIVNEGLLSGLDYVLDEARKRKIKVLLVLTDYFSDEAGGPLQFVELAGVKDSDAKVSKARFFASQSPTPTPTDYFKTYIKQIVERTNTINGRAYYADPTILGYDIANEPRCEVPELCRPASGPLTVTSWARDVATYIKSLDPNHAVTVGLDGFYYTGEGMEVNPFNKAGEMYNTDFVEVLGLDEIDFGSFNIYPDIWGRGDPLTDRAWITDWINQHTADALKLGKPIYIKELGTQPTPAREDFFKHMYTDAFAAMSSVQEGSTGGLVGANFFQAMVKGTEAVWWTLAPGGRWGVYPDDSAYKFVADFAARTINLKTNSVAECQGPQLFPVIECPTGFEGPECDRDVNECVRGTATCDVNAACGNTPSGEFSCQCHPGYTGDGFTCTPDTGVIRFIQEEFYTNYGGNAGGEPIDVAYPAYAPGWAYDPTNTFALKPSANIVNVTLLQCKSACLLAEACTSFFYDPAQHQCILKSRECPYSDTAISPPAECFAQDFTNSPPAQPEGFMYICGQGYTFYKLFTDVSKLANCEAPSSSTVKSAIEQKITGIAANPVPYSHFDAAYIVKDENKIYSFDRSTDKSQVYFENANPASSFISSANLLPDGRMVFSDDSGAICLETAPGRAIFTQLEVPDSMSNAVLLQGAAGGSISSPVLWVASKVGAPSTSFHKYDVASSSFVSTAVLDSSEPQSGLRLAVDPRGRLLVLTLSDSSLTPFDASAQPIVSGHLYDNSGEQFLLCDISFDAFGYLVFAGYLPSTPDGGCDKNFLVDQLDEQTFLLPDDDLRARAGRSLPSGSKSEHGTRFAWAERSTERSAQLTRSDVSSAALPRLSAGPHSARNFRGGNAVWYWAAPAMAPSTSPSLLIREEYSPNKYFSGLDFSTLPFCPTKSPSLRYACSGGGQNCACPKNHVCDAANQVCREGFTKDAMNLGEDTTYEVPGLFEIDLPANSFSAPLTIGYSLATLDLSREKLAFTSPEGMDISSLLFRLEGYGTTLVTLEANTQPLLDLPLRLKLEGMGIPTAADSTREALLLYLNKWTNYYEALESWEGSGDIVATTPGSELDTQLPASAFYREEDGAWRAQFLLAYREAGSSPVDCVDQLSSPTTSNGAPATAFGTSSLPALPPAAQQERLHPGADYACSAGNSVFAAHAGVLTAGNDPGGYGLYAVIVGPLGTTLYGHLDTSIASGSTVAAGDSIGTCGTGTSSLHYEYIPFPSGSNAGRIDPTSCFT